MLCLTLLCTFAACEKSNEHLGDSTEGEATGDTDTSPATEETVISVAELSKYVIVYPEGASEDLVSAATTLASAIGAKFGVNLKAKNDFYSDFMASMGISEHEILLGETNREESATFLQSIGYRDRGYAMIGEKLVIAAHDDYSSSLAVADFNLNVVLGAKKDSDVFYSSTKDSIRYGSYSFGSMTVDGVNISEYRIVYPKNASTLEAGFATKVQKAIAEACGAVLEVVSDETASDGKKEILIGKTNRAVTLSALNGVTDGSGYTALENGNIILCGNSALGNATAIDRFLAAFTGAEAAESIALQIPTGLAGSVREGDKMSAMTFNLWVGGVTPARVDRVVETIIRYLPDTVGLQECSVQWRNYLMSALGDYYTYVGVGRDANDTGEACAILYAKEKFDLVESGTKWLSDTPDHVSQLPGAGFLRTYTWATLQSKSDGVKFLHLNTHLDTSGTDVRQIEAAMLIEFLYEHRDLAIVMTGDFNTAIASTEFAMLTSEFMRNSAEISALRDMGSFAINNMIDYLLVYDLYIDVSYFKVAYERVNGDYASDHRAVYIEYVIDYNGTPVKDNGTGAGGGLVVVPDREGGEYDDPTILF